MSALGPNHQESASKRIRPQKRTKLYKNHRERIDLVCKELDSQFTSFKAQLKDCGKYILSHRPRWHLSETNRGDRRNHEIYDGTATLACRTAQAGMMSGVTSPARPWFRVTHPDARLREVQTVKEWLQKVTDDMTAILQRTNVYKVLPTLYGDLLAFATAAIFVEEDFDNVLHFTSIPIGSFRIGTNARGKVCVYYRDYRMTVRQLIEEYGYDENGEIDLSPFSTTVQNMYEEGNLEAWVDIRHFIGPNPDYRPKDGRSQFKKYESIHFELGRSSTASKYERDREYLRKSGFDYFPVLVPRWSVTGEDSWGTNCPGMDALGDIKQLQFGELTGAQAIELKAKPPMTGPSDLIAKSILPGDYTPNDNADNPFRPVFQNSFELAPLEQKQEQIRARIRRFFFEDLFLMLANDSRSNVTAEEIRMRYEEKLLAVGPVLEQLNGDLLDPLIDILFYVMQRQGYLPSPPPELEGANLQVQYISVMAQAQKLVNIGATERFLNFAVGLINIDENVLDKLDLDQFVDVYAEHMGIVPSLVRPDSVVQKIRSDRAAQAAAAAQQAAIAQAATTAKTMSETNVAGENALERVLSLAQAGDPVLEEGA